MGEEPVLFVRTGGLRLESKANLSYSPLSLGCVFGNNEIEVLALGFQAIADRFF